MKTHVLLPQRDVESGVEVLGLAGRHLARGHGSLEGRNGEGASGEARADGGGGRRAGNGLEEAAEDAARSDGHVYACGTRCSGCVASTEVLCAGAMVERWLKQISRSTRGARSIKLRVRLIFRSGVRFRISASNGCSTIHWQASKDVLRRRWHDQKVPKLCLNSVRVADRSSSSVPLPDPESAASDAIGRLAKGAAMADATSLLDAGSEDDETLTVGVSVRRDFDDS